MYCYIFQRAADAIRFNIIKQSKTEKTQPTKTLKMIGFPWLASLPGETWISTGLTSPVQEWLLSEVWVWLSPLWEQLAPDCWPGGDHLLGRPLVLLSPPPAFHKSCRLTERGLSEAGTKQFWPLVFSRPTICNKTLLLGSNKEAQFPVKRTIVKVNK